MDENGNEVLLRGYTPGGWLVMEGYMMQSEGTAGAQHEFVEKFTELVGEEKTNQFFAKWRENHFMQEDVDSLAAWGFNSIRVPLHYNLFTLPIQEEPNSDQNTWLETGFDIIDNVLEWAEPHQMYVILDMHAAPGGQGRNSEISDYDPSKPSLWESERNKTKLVQLWKKIAERYKDNKWIGGYDLINETNWDLPGGVALRDIYERITTEIRGVGDNHILFIEGNDYGNNHAGLTPPWDDNMVYSFHKYWNSTNENDLDWILPLRDNYNVPLWMGESGENSNKWYTDAVHLFESNNVGWAWWAIKKLGDIDSAFSVIKNPGYQEIINYWKGEGDKPSEDDAFAAMMKLADNLLIKNCLYRKGIKDALLRQPHTNETIPYNKAQEIPGMVYLSDYDLGKSGFAYYDLDSADYNLSTGSFQAWNRGCRYRNDGVDIETNNDSKSNGYHVGFVGKGEWIKYTVNVKEAGLYRADFRHASAADGARFYLSNKNQNLRYPHIGIVLIEDNCEIGCGATIDRGSMSNTVIGKNTFLDNQIHIAHNVKIGENSIIAGQVGIAGSSIIGSNVRIGGQAGISGHINVGNNVEIGGGSGVIKNIPNNTKVMGYPAKNIREFLRDNK